MMLFAIFLTAAFGAKNPANYDLYHGVTTKIEDPDYQDNRIDRMNRSRFVVYNDQEWLGATLFEAPGGYSQDQCVRACALTNSCKYTSFYPDTGACKLLRTYQQMVDNPGVISTSGASQHHPQRDFAFMGQPSHTFKPIGWKSCASLCQSTDVCLSFSWSIDTCNLFDVDPSYLFPNWNSPGSVSGEKPYELFTEDGIELIGHSTVRPNTSSRQLCEAECLLDDDCSYWTYKSTDCYLLNTVTDRVENQDAASGSTASLPIVLKNERVDLSHVYETRLDTTNDICKSFCAADHLCKFWNFYPEQSKCELLNGMTDVQKESGVQSGGSPLYPFVDDGRKYSGSLLDSFVEEDDLSCSASCMFLPECKFYSYNKADKNCRLLSSVTRRDSESSYLSGSKPLYMVTNMANRRFIVSNGHQLGELTDDVPLIQCEKLCHDHPDCVAYNWDRTQCQLLNDYYYLGHETGTSCGYKPGNSIHMTDTRIRGSALLPGHVIISLSVDDALACAIECSEHVDCNFYDYEGTSADTENCWLLRTAESLEKGVGEDSVVGSKPCPYWEKARRGIREGVKTESQPGNEVTDVEACSDFCASNSDCNYWHFNALNMTCTSYVAYTADEADVNSVMGSSPITNIASR